MKIVKTESVMDFNTGELKNEKLSTYYKKVSETSAIYKNPQVTLASEEMAYYVAADLFDGKDEVDAYHMSLGSLQYINGAIAHRLINTDNEMFNVTACWNTNAGHDYHTIEEQGFPVRVLSMMGNLFGERIND